MSIKYAILGMLSYKPLTGYDLKKIMQESPFMYWSGNNNQIYKALVELHDEGNVTSETLHQEGSPSKKVYTITEKGLQELKKLSLSMPEAPEIKKSFLVQLAWTWQLSNEELKNLLDQYEQEIKGQLFIAESKKNKEQFIPNRNPRETDIWNLIQKNVIEGFKQELNWINEAREIVYKYDSVDYTNTNIQNGEKEDNGKMSYEIVEKNSKKYVLLNTSKKQIQTEQDILDLLSICFENESNLLLIQGGLSDDFFNLKTGLAGAILQKFANYNIKVAMVLDVENAKGRFKELLLEINGGNMVNAYPNTEDAENWLLK